MVLILPFEGALKYRFYYALSMARPPGQKTKVTGKVACYSQRCQEEGHSTRWGLPREAPGLVRRPREKENCEPGPLL